MQPVLILLKQVMKIHPMLMSGGRDSCLALGGRAVSDVGRERVAMGVYSPCAGQISGIAEGVAKAYPAP
jgi:hypothetical protein